MTEARNSKIQPTAIDGVADCTLGVPKTRRKADLISEMRRNTTVFSERDLAGRRQLTEAIPEGPRLLSGVI